ncbi:hypothetical protein [Nitrospira sp. Nam80]
MEAISESAVLQQYQPDWRITLQEAIKSAQESVGLRLADLLEEIKHYLTQFVYFPYPSVASLVACWVALTYCYEEFYYSGYLAIRSDLPGSGKTQLLDVLSGLSKGNPPVVTSPTPAVLYRANKGVWLIDEVDNLGNRDKDTYGMVIAVLNAGFKRGGQIIRNEKTKTGYKPTTFTVYGPKGFAGLQKLTDTLEDRSFPVEMVKAPYRLPRLHHTWLSGVAPRIRQDMDTWFDLHKDSIRALYENLPKEMPFLRGYDHRFQDIAEPLVTLAAVADAEVGSIPGHLASVLSGIRIIGSHRLTPEGLDNALLESVSHALGEQNECFVPSKSLLERCRENGLTQIQSEKALSARLSKLGLSSRSNGSVRGYDLNKSRLDGARCNVSASFAASAVGF